MFKSNIITFACLAAMAALTACSPTSSSNADKPASAVAGQAGTVTIATARGDATLTANPATVAVFDLASLDTLHALGVPVAGVPDKLYAPYLQAAADQAKVVGTVFEPNLEALHAMRPDLIIVAARSAPKYDEVRKLAPSIDMSDNGDDLVGDGLKRLDGFGVLFGKQAQAQQLHQELQTLLVDTRAAVKDKGNGLMVMVNGGKLSTFGAGSRFGWIHRDLGVPMADTTIQSAGHGQPISFEFIQKTNPDWLIVLDRGAAIGEEGKSAQSVLDNALVRQTRAWQTGQVVYLSGAAYVAPGGVQQIRQDLQTLKEAFGAAAKK